MPNHRLLLMWLLCAVLLVHQPIFDARAASPESPTPADAPPANAGLTLDEAIGRALVRSPRLQAFGSGISGAQAERRQASVRSNPEIGVDVENIAGGGPYKGFDSTEVTVGVSQELQLGGKIPAREAVADTALTVARIDYRSAALDLIRDVTRAYAEAVAADDTVRLAIEQKALAADVLQSVSARVGAAASPLIQKSRAAVELATAGIALDTAERARTTAFKELAILLGDDRPIVSLDGTAFYAVARPDGMRTLADLTANPDVVKFEARLGQARARLDLEKANAVPNPRVNIGVRDFRDSGDQALVVGVSVPIPVFDANRGNIDKARSDVLRAELENQADERLLVAGLTRAEQSMESAYRRAETLKTEVMPAAEDAFRLAREGYGLGRLPYLEVLDAQRSLFAARQQRIAALTEFHIAKAQVERLTAAQIARIDAAGGDHAN